MSYLYAMLPQKPLSVINQFGNRRYKHFVVTMTHPESTANATYTPKHRPTSSMCQFSNSMALTEPLSTLPPISPGGILYALLESNMTWTCNLKKYMNLGKNVITYFKNISKITDLWLVALIFPKNYWANEVLLLFFSH